MKNRNTQPAWYQLIGTAGIGAVTIIALGLLIFVLITPPNAIGTMSLPDAVKPVAVYVAAAPQETAVPTPSPQPTMTPAPTSTPNILPTRTAEPATAIPPTATPMPTPTPLPPLPGITPRRLRIPSLGINAYTEHVGLDNQNRMDVPRNIFNVAWYKLGVMPGERGNAVIDGHVDGPSTAAVFWTLKNIQVDQRIYVQDDKGQEKAFEVFDVASYPFDQAPIDRIFGPSNDSQLNLITCTGTFDQNTANYDKRLVVYTRLVTNP